jgi:hypothetical protein
LHDYFRRGKEDWILQWQLITTLKPKNQRR